MNHGSRRAIAQAGNTLDGRPRPSASPAFRRSWQRQSVITSALVLLSAALGIYTQAVLAASLGLSGASDAYFAALALVLFASYVVNTSVQNREVPQLARLLDPLHVPTEPFWDRVWRLSRRMTLISVGIGIVLFGGADWVMHLIAPGLAGQSRDIAVASMRVMSLPLAIQLSGSGLVAAQYALRGQPLIQSTALLYSFAVIASMWFLLPAVGPIAAAIGAAVSLCLMFAVVVIATLRLARQPASSFQPPAASDPESSVTLVTLASVVLYGQSVVGPIIASTLAEGTVAQLSFAYRPIDVLARAVPIVIAYMVMPSLAAAHARRDSSEVRSQTSEALRVTLVVVVPVAALLAAVREPVVSFLYQRAAFSAEAAEAVVPALAWYAAALPALSVVVVLTTIFFSVGRGGWSLAMGVAVLSGYSVLGLVLGQRFGGAGVALGFCIANVIVAVGGTLAAGYRNVWQLLESGWFRWTAAGALWALLGGAIAVEATRGLPSFTRLLVGLMLGGLGPSTVVARNWRGLLIR